MKRRLNILCVLVMLVLGYSVFQSVYYAVSAVVYSAELGFKSGLNNDMRKIEEISEMRPVALFPTNLTNLKDSVYNEKSGTFVPVINSQLNVSVKVEPNAWLKLTSMLGAFLDIFASIAAVVLFTGFIVSINRSRIFEWRNVRRLRWLGAMLIFSFLCSAVPVFVAFYELSGVLEIPGYSLTTYGLVSILTLVLGLMSLIVAEVFAIGLKMKEEQELTI